MKVKTKTISVYVAEDGKEFDNHRDAVIHDISLILPPSGIMGKSSYEMAVYFFENRERILELIKGFNKVDSQKRPAAPVGEK